MRARDEIRENAEAEFSSLRFAQSDLSYIPSTGADREVKKEGRRFLDVGLIRKVLVLRREGIGEREVERRLGLQEGVVGMLGRDVFGVAE